ncbi:MAG TPA: hypothetical protein PLP69_07980 [Bacteroidales bacterium]|nr:hypothetical protein [Bacteroidales bacterium]
MKKNLILTALVLCIAVTAGAQNTFNKGDKVLNLGLGLGNAIYTGGYYSTVVPPVSASFELGIIDHLFDDKSSIGVGGYIGYMCYRYDYSIYDYKISSLILSTKGAFHYQLVNKLDTYAGLLIGLNFESDNDPDYDWSSTTLKASEFVGARYYFTDNFAGMAEIGYGIAYLNLGISLKF